MTITSATRIHRRTLACALTLALFASSAALADESVRFDIGSQPLVAALKAFAEQSSMRLLYEQDAVRHVTANPVVGNFGKREALEKMLQGTGVEVVFSGDNAATIRVRVDQGASIESASDLGTEAPVEEQMQAEPMRNAQTREGAVAYTSHGVAEMDAVVVTGTRIRGAPLASPLIVVTQEDMLNAGYTDLGEAARNIPQNFNGGQNPGVAGGGNQGGQNNITNSSTLNLRGFGADATLTLINGHRVAYDGLNQGVDISAIPIAAVERIEVVADGASALYGSDAVGGVANIILRREFEGATFTTRFGVSTDGGNERQQYSAVAGGRWASGGWMAALDYSHSTAITARDRSYTRPLDDSLTLLPEQEQHSIVVAGNQRISDAVRLELDGHYSNRDSTKANPFFATSDVLTNGLLNSPSTRSSSLTPTLRVRLPAKWEGSISATRAESEVEIRSRRFSNGVQTAGLLVYKNEANAFEANAEGPLFRAPGGDARLAMGAGYRSIGLDVLVNQTPPNGATVTTRDLTDGRDIYFGYGELSLPLVGPENHKLLVERLVVNAAVRYEDYRDIGGVSTPKLGLIYEPTADVVIKISWGKSFKAPTLNQENTIVEGALLPGAIFTPPTSGSAPVLLVGGGSIGQLQPERATTWTATIGMRPRFMEGLNVEASYFDIRYTDRVTSPVTNLLSSLGNPIFADFVVHRPSAAQLHEVIASLPQGLSNQTGAAFDPDNVAAIINSYLQNVARERARGIDLSADYGIDLGPQDRLQLMASASYLESDRQLSPGQPTLSRAGRIFNPPHWRARMGATWQRSNLTLSGFANYIGGNLDDRYQPFERVGSLLTLDAVARVKSTATAGLFHNFEAGLSVLNLLNEKPHIIRNSNAADPTYDSLNYSVVGRFVGITFTKRLW